MCEKEKSGLLEWSKKCLIRVSGEHKVLNKCPKTWILRREKEKFGPRKGSIKCLNCDVKYRFNARNAKIRSVRVEHKVSNL